MKLNNTAIAFLLASLAASSSLLFHKTEAKKIKGDFKECRTGKDIIVLENQGGEFKIFNFATGKREALPFKFFEEKKALKEFKKLCKGEKTNAIDDRKAIIEERKIKAKEESKRRAKEESKRRAIEERKAKNKFKNKF